MECNVMCNDNRYELISKYKEMLIEGTNIDTSPAEMAVIDNILFRFWQMGWLDKIEEHIDQDFYCGFAERKEGTKC